MKQIITFVLSKVKNNNAIKLLLFVIYVFLIAEILSYVSYLYVVPANLKEPAKYVLGFRQDRSDEVTSIIDDLWTNYQLNSLSLRGNEHGWRYGGGNKKKKIRIACLGGSTTYSDPVPTGDLSYPAQLEKYLQQKGLDVEVVNCGMPYYSSAEVLANYCFKGVYLNADIVIIMTGLNDTEPLISPFEYKNDYSHWRRANSQIGKDVLFKRLWKLKSWTIRLTSLLLIKPGQGEEALNQVSTIYEAAESKDESYKKRYPITLSQNLSSLIGIIKNAKAQPILVIDNYVLTRNATLYPKYSEMGYPEFKLDWSYKKCMAVVDSVGKASNLLVIPFNKFEPSKKEFWTDHCHLNTEGTQEQAVFIGNFILNDSICLSKLK